ncbi:hypothetical protein [Natronorarus salvus]|uniref:hypothetical protein n=1 Tax=Natronorarus salvus TaxID=3117733 RepID=UPI002F263B25
MVDLVTPGEIGAEADSRSWGHALGKAGVAPWIVHGVDIAGAHSEIDDTALDGFNYVSSSGLDVTISAGEAYVYGWLVRDRETTVTLPAGATTTIYLGYDVGAVLAEGEAPSDSENVIIGEESEFGDGDPRTPIWEFETDSSSVVDDEWLGVLEQPLVVEDGALTPQIPFSVSGDLGVSGDINLTGNNDLYVGDGEGRFGTFDGEVTWYLNDEEGGTRWRWYALGNDSGTRADMDYDGNIDFRGSAVVREDLDVGNDAFVDRDARVGRRVETNYSASSGVRVEGDQSTIRWNGATSLDLYSGDVGAHQVRVYPGDRTHVMEGLEVDGQTQAQGGISNWGTFWGNGRDLRDLGDVEAGGELTTSGREVLSVQKDWDGDEMILQSESGTEIRLTSED